MKVSGMVNCTFSGCDVKVSGMVKCPTHVQNLPPNALENMHFVDNSYTEQ